MKKGFTLIELLVVILIIGILAALALPQYNKAVAKARAVEGRTTLVAISRAQLVYLMAEGDFTTDLNNLDIDVRDTNKTSYLCVFPSNGGAYIDCIANIPANRMRFIFAVGRDGGIRQRCVAQATDAVSTEICRSMGTFAWREPGGDFYDLVN